MTLRIEGVMAPGKAYLYTGGVPEEHIITTMPIVGSYSREHIPQTYAVMSDTSCRVFRN